MISSVNMMNDFRWEKRIIKNIIDCLDYDFETLYEDTTWNYFRLRLLFFSNMTIKSIQCIVNRESSNRYYASLQKNSDISNNLEHFLCYSAMFENTHKDCWQHPTRLLIFITIPMNSAFEQKQ